MTVTITLSDSEIELLDRALMEYGHGGAADLWYRIEDAREAGK